MVSVETEDADLDEDPEVLTVPDLFDLVQDHIDAHSLTVEYDPHNGRVEELYFELSEDMTDDQLTIVVRSFEAGVG